MSESRIRELEERIREIEERERRLRLALLASDDEIWEYAIAEDRIAFEHEITGAQASSTATTAGPGPSATPATNHALTAVRGQLSLADFIATIHPDHRDALRGALDALSGARSEFEEVTIRRRHRGGGWVWVQL